MYMHGYIIVMHVKRINHCRRCEVLLWRVRSSGDDCQASAAPSRFYSPSTLTDPLTKEGTTQRSPMSFAADVLFCRHHDHNHAVQTANLTEVALSVPNLFQLMPHLEGDPRALYPHRSAGHGRHHGECS